MLEDALEELTSGKGSLRCHEVVSILEGLGFEIRRTKKGHYVYNHPKLDGFWGGSFACPHKSGDPVLKSYITRIIGSLRQNEAELNNLLGVDDD